MIDRSSLTTPPDRTHSSSLIRSSTMGRCLGLLVVLAGLDLVRAAAGAAAASATASLETNHHKDQEPPFVLAVGTRAAARAAVSPGTPPETLIRGWADSHDWVVGLLYPPAADFSQPAFAVLAGAFEDGPGAAQTKSSQSVSWKATRAAMENAPFASVAHGAVPVDRLVNSAGFHVVDLAELERLATAPNEKRPRRLLVRLPGIDPRNPTDARLDDVVLGQAWEWLADASKGSAVIFLAEEADDAAGSAAASAASRRRDLAAPTTQPSSTNKTRKGTFIRMVPELIVGLLVTFLLVVLLIAFYCCCLDAIEAPTSWTTKLPPKGKEFN